MDAHDHLETMHVLTPHVAPARAAQRPEAVAAGRLLLTACLINSLSRRITQYGSKRVQLCTFNKPHVNLCEIVKEKCDLFSCLFCAYG